VVEFAPVTVNSAAVTVPVTAGSVTPPVYVRVGVPKVAGKVTVPNVVELIAMLPNAMSTFLAMLSGVMMFAEALEVADKTVGSVAKEETANVVKRAMRTKIFFMFFIGI
jgi:hypothetical protein